MCGSSSVLRASWQCSCNVLSGILCTTRELTWPHWQSVGFLKFMFMFWVDNSLCLYVSFPGLPSEPLWMIRVLLPTEVINIICMCCLYITLWGPRPVSTPIPPPYSLSTKYHNLNMVLVNVNGYMPELEKFLLSYITMDVLLKGFCTFVCIVLVWEQELWGTAAALKMTFHWEQKVSTEKQETIQTRLQVSAHC